MIGDRLLLDTHVLLWWAEDDPRLPMVSDATIRSAATVFVSVATAWEIAIKISAGKLSLAMPLGDIVGEAGFEVLPITLEHTTEVARLPRHHRDPFDRMLVAQARHERLTLITHDRRLFAYDVAIIRA
jgi:PIN domain nuclease of toxin-antitoxin system